MKDAIQNAPPPASAEAIAKAVDAAATKLAAAPPASAEAIAKAVDAAATKLAAAPPWREMMQRLQALEGAVRSIGDKPTGLPPDALNALTRTVADLGKTLGDTNSASAGATRQAISDGVARLSQHLDAIASALRTMPPSTVPPAIVPMDGLIAAIKDVASAVRDTVPGVPPPVVAKLDEVVAKLTSIDEHVAGLDSAPALTPVLEHLTLIEELISEINHPVVRSCQKLDPLALPQLNLSGTEERLVAAARRAGLTWARKYRVTARQLFYNAEATALSPIGERVLRLIVEDARQHGRALLVRAEADAASDGEAADTMAAGRAAGVAGLIERYGAVPVLGFGLAHPAGTVSEPYRRLVRIDILEPCQ